MKTYLKKYEVIDVKGYLDVDGDGKKYIMYNEDDQSKRMDIDDLLDMMLGSAVQFKTLVE